MPEGKSAQTFIQYIRDEFIENSTKKLHQVKDFIVAADVKTLSDDRRKELDDACLKV